MEAPLAALSSARLYNLIKRVFHSRPRARHSAFGVEKSHYSAFRRLVQRDRRVPEDPDSAWLQRTELRCSDAVIDMLERSGFREQRGARRALFVDGRCGLIHSYCIATEPEADPEMAVGEILSEASDCHADGIILATNDLQGKAARTAQTGKLACALYRKGEAIEIFLLDHFILTPSGWKRVLSFAATEQS